MTQLTAQFSQCSQQVITLEQELAGTLQCPQAAELLREVQQAEREKLQLTLSLQALRAAHAHKRFSWQVEEEAEAAAAAMGLMGWPGHICSIGCNHQSPDNEPTQVPPACAVHN